MRTHGIAALMAAALVCTGCSTLKVTTESRPGTDFSAFKTFALKDVPELKDSMIFARIKTATSMALVAKGLTQQAEKADLLVVLQPRLSKETHVNSVETGYGAGYGPGYAYGPTYGYGYGYSYGMAWSGMGSTTTTIKDVPVGTLIVDLVDVKTNQMVWRGLATDTINQSASSETRESNLNHALQKLFSSYPKLK